MFQLDFSHAKGVDPSSLYTSALDARQLLESKKGPGSDFLGWLDLPETAESLVPAIEKAAEAVRNTEALVVVGIGGSYLGARCVTEALARPFTQSFPIHFAGHHLDAGYHAALLDHLKSRRYSVNVISKSGTTTEPGLAFRYLWNDLSHRYPKDLASLVFATTDAKKGGLRKLADANGLQAFVIADDVGGRYSVLSPVGLLPIAAAGHDIRALLQGARDMMHLIRKTDDPAKNPAVQYAAWRNAAYKAGKKIELFVSYRPGLHFLSEWWKQLFGESEGKNGKGIFPASVDLTTDLHSMGQWIQEGERTLFETVIDVEEDRSLLVPKAQSDDDGLNYLAGKSLGEVNRTALAATLSAHESGGVPCLRLAVPRIDERTLGALMYLFEYACGISAYMLGVNPFDQPGVEAYKKAMFRLLGRPT
ncbi:MAG: glucose-6-phosphate isomerase [Spirochaetia bacterium]|nr:glucose-6-phosphate isomerase [Spirochaetia bacterium]